jgi:hypothetical protein
MADEADLEESEIAVAVTLAFTSPTADEEAL